MKKRDITILQKITQEAALVAEILDGIEESGFLKNEEKKRAISMTLINIGELVKNHPNSKQYGIYLH